MPRPPRWRRAGAGMARLVATIVLLLSLTDDLLSRFRLVTEGSSWAAQLPMMATMTLTHLALASSMWWPWAAVGLTLLALVSASWSQAAGPSLLALAVAAVMLVAVRSWRQALAGIALMTGAAVAVAAWAGRLDQWAPGMVVVSLVAATIGAAVRSQINGVRAIEQRAEALQRAREELVAQDRARFARELHDGVGHALATITLQCTAFQRSDDLATLQAALGNVEGLARRGTDQMRQLVDNLRDAARSPMSLRQAPPTELALQARQQLAACGWQVRGRVDGGLDDLRAMHRSAVTHFIQEATANIIRHAEPNTPLTLELVLRGGSLVCLAENRVAAAPVASDRAGTGVVGLHELAAQLGGRAGGSQERGVWRLRMEIPLNTPEVLPADATGAPAPVA